MMDGVQRFIHVVIAWKMMMIFSVTLTGCLYFRSHLVGIDQSARYMNHFNYEELEYAEGSSSCFTLFGLAQVTSDLSYNEAVNEAVRGKGGDNLIEVTSWREKKVYIVGVVDELHVRGKVIRYKIVNQRNDLPESMK